MKTKLSTVDTKCLPDDIRIYIRRKIYFRILDFFILETLAVVFLAFQKHRIIEIAGRADLLIASIALIILPFLIMGIPLKFIDSTWHGTVVDIKVTTTIDFTGRFSGSKGLGGMYHKNTILLKVKKNNGRIVKVKALELGVENGVTTLLFDGVIFGRLDDHIGDFQTGDEVYHFYGLKRPFIIHNSQREFTYCVICGYRNSADEDVCSGCGHSLIKNIDNKNAPI